MITLDRDMKDHKILSNRDLENFTRREVAAGGRQSGVLCPYFNTPTQ